IRGTSAGLRVFPFFASHRCVTRARCGFSAVYLICIIHGLLTIIHGCLTVVGVVHCNKYRQLQRMSSRSMNVVTRNQLLSPAFRAFSHCIYFDLDLFLERDRPPKEMESTFAVDIISRRSLTLSFLF